MVAYRVYIEVRESGRFIGYSTLGYYTTLERAEKALKVIHYSDTIVGAFIEEIEIEE